MSDWLPFLPLSAPTNIVRDRGCTFPDTRNRRDLSARPLN